MTLQHVLTLFSINNTTRWVIQAISYLMISYKLQQLFGDKWYD